MGEKCSPPAEVQAKRMEVALEVQVAIRVLVDSLIDRGSSE